MILSGSFLLQNINFHHLIMKIQQVVWILSNLNLIQIFTTYIPKIHFNIIIYVYQMPLFRNFLYKQLICISCFSHPKLLLAFRIPAC
jgi:hypothetical protein